MGHKISALEQALAKHDIVVASRWLVELRKDFERLDAQQLALIDRLESVFLTMVNTRLENVERYG